MEREELEIAYVQTTYIVHTKKQIFNIRIGTINFDFQNWLKQNNIQTWAMMTAANPYSKELSEEQNKKRNGKFEQTLKYLQKDYYHSEGIPDDPKWITEIGFFIPNIDLKVAEDLAKSVEQNAIVFGRGGEEAQLVWLK